MQAFLIVRIVTSAPSLLMTIRRLLPVLIVLSLAPLVARAQVTLRIDAPELSFNKLLFRYEPYPVQVTVVVKNNGNTATQAATARIEIIPPFSFDASEMSVTIKQLLPSVVAAHDSAKATWLLLQPPQLSSLLQRVVFWVKFGATDSSMVGRNILIPAAGPPLLSTSLSGISDLHVRADSLGYDGNPFTVYAGLINSGETRADSVRLQLQLPADFVLDPASQQNPVTYAQYPPAPITDPHYSLPFTVRYTGCTRVPRSDSLVVLVTGRNIAGAPVSTRSSKPIMVDGIAPAYTLFVDAPDALQYDTATTYAPNPMTATAVVKNIGEQTELLPTIALDIAGDGASARQVLTRSIGALAPQETKSVSWDVDVARSAAPRTLVFSATVTDGDQLARMAAKNVRVPGKPFALEITDVRAPDSIPTNAERTAYTVAFFDVSFRVRNGFWKNVRVLRTRITPIGTGVSPGGPVEEQPDSFLKPDETSTVYTGNFRIIGGYGAHTVTFELLAISSEGDTAVTRVAVFFPLLIPRVSIMRSGLDSLAIDAGSMTYSPNPFEQRFVVRNDGSAPIALDSLTVDASGDGIARNGTRTFIFATSLPPLQSTQAQAWTFAAEKRATAREVRIAYTAWFNKIERVTDTAAVFIPGMEAKLDFALHALPSVDFDSIEIYQPTHITAAAIARNAGPVAFRVDSIRFLPAAPWGPVPVAAQKVDVLLQPGDTLRVTWPAEFVPTMLADTLRCRFLATVFYDSSRSRTAEQQLAIPGRPTSLQIELLPKPSDLTLRPDGKDYNENPLATAFRVYNDSWVLQTLTKTEFTMSGSGVHARTPLTRSPAALLSPSRSSVAIIDSFDIDPSSFDRTIDYTISATSSRGLVGSLAQSFRIPKIQPVAVDAVPQLETALRAPYPNPSTAGEISIPFTLAIAAHARIDAYNALGEHVATLADGEYRPGTHVLSCSAFPMRGVYVLRMTVGGHAFARSVIIR